MPGLSAVREERSAAGEGALPENASLPQSTAQFSERARISKDGEPLGGGFGIGDGAVAGLGRRIGQDQGVDAPEIHLGGQAFAVARDVANQPDARFFPVLGGLADEGGEERVGRLGGVIEHEFALTGGQRGQACCEIRVSHGAAKPAVRGKVRAGHAEAIGAM